MQADTPRHAGDSPPVESTAPRIPLPQVDWIADEEALRDEAVIHGLLGLAVENNAKFEAIDAYFDQVVARFRHKAQQIDNALQHHQQELARLQKQSAELTEQHAQTEAPDSSHAAERFSAGRYLVGLLLAITICVTNWWLLSEYVPLHFSEPGIIAVAVMLAGFFVVFEPKSILYVSDDTGEAERAELWKVRLLEFGMPLAAAALFVSWGVPASRWPYGIALFAYVFLLFLFSGKLLLTSVSQISVIRQHIERHWHERTRRKKSGDAFAHLRSERIPAVEREIERLQREQLHLPDSKVINDERRRIRAVFTSAAEYAQEALRQQAVTESEVTDILGDKE